MEQGNEVNFGKVEYEEVMGSGQIRDVKSLLEVEQEELSILTAKFKALDAKVDSLLEQ